jgi:phosphoribosylformylglycinamidine (FGAM) synthase-like enzyme
MIALFESGFNRNLGFNVKSGMEDGELRQDAYWLGEAQSRVLMSCSPDKVQELKHRAASPGIDIALLGTVTNSAVIINSENWGEITTWKSLYDTAIEKILNN